MRFKSVLLLAILSALVSTSLVAQSSITTVFRGNWTGHDGNMFDVTVKDTGLTVTSIDVNNQSAVNSAVVYEIYYKTGTYVSSIYNSSAWTRHEVVNSVCAGRNLPTKLTLSSPLKLAANTTYGFYVTHLSAASGNYSSNSSYGSPSYSNSELSMSLGHGVFHPFRSASANCYWNGTIHYTPDLRVKTPANLPTAVAGTPYSENIEAEFGTPAYSWQNLTTPNPLPSNLQLSVVSGAFRITGTPQPADAGTYNFTVEVTDSASPTRAKATKAMTLLIEGVQINNANPLPSGQVGSPYSQTFTASNGPAPYTWALSSGTLPSGLSFNPVTATLSGTPTGDGGGYQF
ncbi:Ig domain-containing protein, partial [Planctomycetota bacterium]|nr:Ig domain-containing protein [Planctomycetota bacterium]